MITEPVYGVHPLQNIWTNFGNAEPKTSTEELQSPLALVEEKEATEAHVQQLAKELNEHLRATSTEMNFSIDKETDKLVLKIIDSKTHEVIRQIPAEEALRRSLHISKLLGFLVDGNA